LEVEIGEAEACDSADTLEPAAHEVERVLVKRKPSVVRKTRHR
jgi:hypothetical protein